LTENLIAGFSFGNMLYFYSLIAQNKK